MSLHNLLELDTIENQPVRDQPGISRPKPKPRVIRKNSDGKPHPKPRRRVDRDVDEILSVSSVSSGDHRHAAQSAFDNPVFQGEDDDVESNSNRNTKLQKHERTYSISTDSESERSFSQNRSRTRKKSSNKSRKKSYLNSKEDLLQNSSSAWEEEESYLRIENETDIETKQKNITIKTSGISSRKSSIGLSNDLEDNDGQKSSKEKPKPKYKKKGKEESHVTIEVEEETSLKLESQLSRNNDEKIIDMEKPRSSKGFIGRWKDLLNKTSASGASQSQSIEKSEKIPDKTQRKDSIDKEDKGKKVKEKQMKAKEDTVIPIQSEEELSGDDMKEKEGIEMTTSSKNDEKLEVRRKKFVAETIMDKIRIIKPKSKPKPHVSEEINEKSDAKLDNSGIEEQEQVLGVDSDDEVDHGSKTHQKQRQSTKKIKKQKPKYTVRDSHHQDLLLGITVHSSDILPLDLNILHPVVKVTVMSQEGQLIQRTHGFLSSEALNENESVEGRKNESKKTRKKEQKGSVSWKKTKPVENILPIMTQPYQMNLRNLTFSPSWNELLLFEEPFEKFLDENANVVIFFEIMDFLPMNSAAGIPTSGYHGNELGWYKIAWAFLKPVGANGELNIERKLRLQLFKPTKLRAKDIQPGPEVYSFWKSGKREKIVNTTLYITLKGINPPTGTRANLQQLLSMRKDDLTEAIIEGQLSNNKTSKRSKKRLDSNRAKKHIDIRKDAKWTRLEGQSCKVPNTLIASLPSSQIRSLSITVSGNVYCLKFSPCGFKLAAGLDTEELHAVLIFEIPSGTLLRSLKNHHGLIYDLNWKLTELDDDNYFHYLASASADSTAIIWSMKNHEEDSLRIVKTLHHPSYVYCVQFHPTHPSVVVTGCFDNIIRVWDFGSRDVNFDNDQERKKSNAPDVHDSCPIFILDRHISFVNSLLFDSVGSFLFSGDGNSCVYKWSIKSPTKKRSWKIEKDVKLTDTGRIAVNSLSLHPNGNRLLVHLRDNCLKIIDVTTFIQLQVISGFVNDKLQIRSCFSPCGNLVLSGSENAIVGLWDADTSNILQFISPKNHPNCFVTSVDYHPYDFYMAVGLASSISEPSPILLYGYKAPKLAPIVQVQSSIAKFKSNLRKKQSQSVDGENEIRKNVTFAAQRGKSSEKFLDIINKLDEALKQAQDPKRMYSSSQSINKSLNFDLDRNQSRPHSASEVIDVPGLGKQERFRNSQELNSNLKQHFPSKPPRKSKSP